LPRFGGRSVDPAVVADGAQAAVLPAIPAAIRANSGGPRGARSLRWSTARNLLQHAVPDELGCRSIAWMWWWWRWWRWLTWLDGERWPRGPREGGGGAN